MTTEQCEWRYLMTPARAEAPEAVFGVRFGCRGERGSWMTTAEVGAATHCCWCERRIVHTNAPAFSFEEALTSWLRAQREQTEIGLARLDRANAGNKAPWWWPDTDDEGYIVLPDPSDGSLAREAYEKVASALLYYHDTIDLFVRARRSGNGSVDEIEEEIERLHERMNRGLS